MSYYKPESSSSTHFTISLIAPSTSVSQADTSLIILVAFPEPSIHNNWGEFVDQLNTYFGQPDLAQASECALCALKIQDYQHVNKLTQSVPNAKSH